MIIINFILKILFGASMAAALFMLAIMIFTKAITDAEEKLQAEKDREEKTF